MDKANEYLIQQAQGLVDIYAPSLLDYELHNTLARLTNKRPPQLLTFIKNLDIRIIPLSDEIITETYHLFDSYSISFYDATYVALAKSLDCDLITADKKLVKAVNLPFVKLLM